MATLVFFFCVQLVSLFMVYVSLKWLYAYIRAYRFDETIYTLLFGFLHLRYFVALYIGAVVLTVIVETIYAFSFLPQ